MPSRVVDTVELKTEKNSFVIYLCVCENNLVYLELGITCEIDIFTIVSKFRS